MATPHTRALIGLVGHAGAGKDTVADRLTNYHGFHRLTLADHVRDAALALNPVIEHNTPTADPTEPTAHTRLSELVATHGWHAAKQIPDVRRTLQRLGTEAGWKMHGVNLWTSRVDKELIDLIDTNDNPAVVTDIRMPHEVNWLTNDHGGILVGVRRDNAYDLGDNSRHASEADIDKLFSRCTHLIDNNNSLADLFNTVDNLATALRSS